MTEETTRPKVCNVDSEVAILASLMMENNLIDTVADRLKPEDFSEALFGRIYSVIVREASLGRAANVATMRPYLEKDPALEELGGLAFLARMTANTGYLTAFRTSVEQVIDMARRRKLIEGLEQALEMAADMSATSSDVVSLTDAALSDLNDNDDSVVQISAAKAFDEMVDAYAEEVGGVTCGGIVSLDNRLGPIRKHHLVIAGGRPGMGKTVLAMSYSLGAAENGHGVLYVSLEMSRVDLMQRAAADVGYQNGYGVPYEHIRDNKFQSDADRRYIYRTREHFDRIPLHIVDASSMTIGRLNMIVQRYKRRMAAQGQKLELVVIDYLQLLRADYRCSPYENVSEVSRGLKAIAKRHDIGIMALAQLSRAVEQREDKRPKLADLRESGQIEQDADAIIFLYRQEYYLRETLPDEGSPDYPILKDALDQVTGDIDLIIAKRRNGPTGVARARFNADYLTIRSSHG